MPNLSLTSLNQVAIGDTIKFTVKDYNDNVTYAGTVVAICDDVTARSFEDIVARHQSMLAADGSLDVDITKYRFIIVDCYDGVRRPFAYHPVSGKSWFTEDKVEVLVPDGTYTITLNGVNSVQANIALRILKEQGYSCSLS